MKLQIASDIHREFGHNPEIPDAGGDVLVLAGDIGYANEKTVEWLRGISDRYEAVLYVPGNHEFYGSYLRKAAANVDRKAAYGGYNWLNNRPIEVEGQRFVGTPLWANFCGDPLSMIEAGRSISDFDQIWFGKGRRLTPEIMLTLHKEAKAFLEATVRPGDIVITHWPPTLEARNHNYAVDGIAKYFSADISDFVMRSRASLWVCGHTHYNVDFMLGETRILSNQGWYPHESGKGLPGYDPWRLYKVGPDLEHAPEGAGL